MFYYEDLSCPVCNQSFTAEDDIVVCPQCGLPHHRACWKKIGKCFEDDNHGTPNQWHRDRNTAASPKEAKDDVPMRNKTCSHCGAMNIEYAEFCDTCGHALGDTDWQSGPTSQEQPPVREYSPFNWQPDSYSPYPERIQGIPTNELIAVVGNNSHYYIPRFAQIDRGTSGGWNWAAFLLGPFWLFYRKQFGLGWLYFAVMMLSNIPFAVLYAPVQFAETEAAAEAAITAMTASALFTPVMLLSLVFLILKIILGIKANEFYFHFCAKKIADAKEKTPDLSASEMTSLGGVSVGLAVLFYILSTIVVDIVTIISI